MAQPAPTADLGWLWYTQKTSDCAPLDRKIYPSVIYDGYPKPWPDWVCGGPSTGGHINASLAAIDAHVEKPPNRRDEVGWTCDFGVFLVAKAWFAAIEDLVDRESVFVGDVLLDGVKLNTWATVHGRLNPALSSRAGSTRHCPNCGNVATVIHGRVFFSDPAVIGRALIVNWNGIFVREDIAASRNLRTPKGAFKPSVVRFTDLA